MHAQNAKSRVRNEFEMDAFILEPIDGLSGIMGKYFYEVFVIEAVSAFHDFLGKHFGAGILDTLSNLSFCISGTKKAIGVRCGILEKGDVLFEQNNFPSTGFCC